MAAAVACFSVWRYFSGEAWWLGAILAILAYIGFLSGFFFESTDAWYKKIVKIVYDFVFSSQLISVLSILLLSVVTVYLFILAYNAKPNTDDLIVKCTQYTNKACPLKISSFSFENAPPNDSMHAGIKWNDNTSELRLLLKNNNEDAIEDISIAIEPETSIYDARQISKIPNVALTPDRGPVNAIVLEIVTDKGERQYLRGDDRKLSPLYRISCPKLLYLDEIEIVIACVVVNNFISGKPPDKLFGKRRNPKWICLNGSYKIKTITSEIKYDLKYVILLNDKINNEICYNKGGFEEIYNTGEEYIKSYRPCEAVKCFSKALELDSNSAKAHFGLGASYYLMKKSIFAIDEFESTIRLNPKHAPSYFNIGLMLKDSKPDEAFTMYKNAIEADPNFLQAYYHFGLDLFNSGHFDEAITKFSELSNRIQKADDVMHLETLGLWGAALEKLNKQNDAIKKYNQIIRLAPNSEQAETAHNSISKLMGTEKQIN